MQARPLLLVRGAALAFRRDQRGGTLRFVSSSLPPCPRPERVRRSCYANLASWQSVVLTRRWHGFEKGLGSLPQACSAGFCSFWQELTTLTARGHKGSCPRGCECGLACQRRSRSKNTALA